MSAATISIAMSENTTSSLEERNGVAEESLDRQQATVSDQSSSNNLEKIRDILVGSQMREVEKRFAHLEDLLTKLSYDLREDLNKSLTSLETSFKKEIESLNDRFLTELNEVKTLSLELKALRDFSWQKWNQLEEQGTKNLGELSRALSEEIRQKHQELTEVVERVVQDLHSNKTDRASLAALFNEVATRLNTEARRPDGE
jgi:thymidylate synthase